jgi:hypothetical protein
MPRIPSKGDSRVLEPLRVGRIAQTPTLPSKCRSGTHDRAISASETADAGDGVHQLDGGGGYGQRFLRSGLTGLSYRGWLGACRPGRGAGTGHAPFRRVIELAVRRSVLDTVSFPGRACHPLTTWREKGWPCPS